MKVIFEYNRDKDIWCLLYKGKNSNNDALPTQIYTQLIADQGAFLDEAKVGVFIDQYLQKYTYDTKEIIGRYEKEFSAISGTFQKICERVFDVVLEKEITAYLTINERFPYSIENSWFFVPLQNKPNIKNIMHEIWHFYTWYKFGQEWRDILGKQKYNDLKEALTVLINVECAILLSQGEQDNGYSQHADLRHKILQLWGKSQDINALWNELVKV